MNTSPTLFIIASEIELNAFYSNQARGNEGTLDNWIYYRHSGLIVVMSGMGTVNAACAAHAFIKEFNPKNCIQIGLSGAHKNSLRIGDILLGKEVKDFSRHNKTPEGDIIPRPHFIQQGKKAFPIKSFEADKTLYQTVESLFDEAQCPFQSAVIGSADQFNRNSQYIQKIQSIFGTWCEDMESAAVAQVTERWSVPYLAIRVISNNELTQEGKTEDGKRFNEIAFQRINLIGNLLLNHFDH